MRETYPFALRPLPYSYDALEPYIDEETMYYHHDKHLKTYVDNLNNALKPYPQFHHLTLEQLLADVEKLPDSIRTAVKNNGGGVYNHNFYFAIMTPEKSEAEGKFLAAVIRDFSSMENMQAQLKQAALGRFGSGYAWLYLDNDCQLKITSTANQDTLLQMDVCPLLPVDVWEHAYYLKHKNLRADYMDDWFEVVDWKKVSTLFENCPLCQ